MGDHTQLDAEASRPMARFDDGAVERDLQVAFTYADRKRLAREQMEVPGDVERQPVVPEEVTGKPV